MPPVLTKGEQPAPGRRTVGSKTYAASHSDSVNDSRYRPNLPV